MCEIMLTLDSSLYFVFLCFYLFSLQVILKSDKTSDNFSDRSILKSLGKWLGMQTVAKNKPILHIVSIP